MAYVKHTAIHTTPKAHLKYILNPEKNEKMKYVTGICCGDDLETAYDNFKEIFESGISVFIRTRSHSTAPFLPKKHIA